MNLEVKRTHLVVPHETYVTVGKVLLFTGRRIRWIPLEWRKRKSHAQVLAEFEAMRKAA